MSVAAISSSSLFDVSNQNVVSKREKIQQEFQQLGQDLQSGDLTAAQTDFTTLQQLVPKLASIPTTAAGSTTGTTTGTAGATTSAAASTPTTTVASTDPRVQAFAQLEQDIQSGNTSGAQQDYSNIQQIFQQRASEHNNHRFHTGGFSGAPGVSTLPGGVGSLPSGVGQLFQQLGQALQSGDLNSAKQAYSSLQQDFLQVSQSSRQEQAQSASPSVSFNA
jgi:outer membrane protein assembly factor BamD (BamD/ComL family)